MIHLKSLARGTSLLAAAVLLLAGCQTTPTSGTGSSAPASRETGSAPRTATVQSAAPASSSAEINSGLVTLAKSAPAEVGIGESYAYTLVLTALQDVADVVVTETLPSQASFAGSTPEAVREGDRLVWRFPAMNQGEVRRITVNARADAEGTLVCCATVTAIPRACVQTLVGRPVLAISKTGPAEALINSEVPYSIVVTNTGTTVARNVVVTDTVPAGLAHPSGNSTVTFSAGDLLPGQSATFPISLRAMERGRHCNGATAVAANAGEVSAEACTIVRQPGIDVEKTGTESQFINRRATYAIVVTNTGDTTLTNVVVTDTAPAETTIVSAPGASLSGNTATWTIASLGAGESRTLDLTLTATQGGRYCNNVSVAAAEGVSDSATACTTWRGVTGVLLELVDDPDPIQVGETVTYTVRITNQGTADITNSRMVLTFESEILPVSTAGGGIVSGQTVTFPDLPVLAAKQSVTYTITARGSIAGDSRTRAVLTAEQLRAPVNEEESTTVY